MTSAVQADTSHDLTNVNRVVRYAIILGVIEAVTVGLVSLTNYHLEGIADSAVTGVWVALGAIAVIFLPGIWTRARTIEGIAGAAGIGLGASLTFMVLDIAILQPLGTWTNRWYAVGGHSNWWYQPVWWMVGCYLSWQGAWILAHQVNRNGKYSLPAAIGLVAILMLVIGAAAAAFHFPLAQWKVPTFAIATLPALALANLLSWAFGSRS